jgi:hypothetical protein
VFFALARACINLLPNASRIALEFFLIFLNLVMALFRLRQMAFGEA